MGIHRTMIRKIGNPSIIIGIVNEILSVTTISTYSAEKTAFFLVAAAVRLLVVAFFPLRGLRVWAVRVM